MGWTATNESTSLLGGARDGIFFGFYELAGQASPPWVECNT